MKQAFTKNGNVPLYKQVVAWFEQQVENDVFKPGDRVPATNALAEELGIGRKAVQQGLEILAERGYFERSPGRGTFIAQNIRNNTIGVVFPRNLLTEQAFGFYRLVCSAFLQEAPKMGYQISLIIPTDDDKQRLQDEVERMTAVGRIRGIINFTDITFSSCSIRAVVHSGAYRQSTRDSLAFRGLSYVIARGFRKIALIEHNQAQEPTELTLDAVRLVRGDFSSDIEVKLYQGSTMEESRSGRALVHQILTQEAEAPDVLVVTDDNLTRGVIFGLLEMGKKIPDDIALITHANKGGIIPSPVPLTMLENNPEAFARESLRAIIAMFNGEPFTPLPLEATLIVGKSCGE